MNVKEEWRKMDDEFRFVIKALLGLMAAFILLALSLEVFGAAMEARSYRKHCDTPVTTWDALWLDLRIDECEE